MSLSDQSFVVTGGASGVGKAVVKKLVDQSAKVYVIDVSEIPTDHDSPGKLVPFSGVDISSRQAVKSVFDEISRQDSELRGLVNCAGILRPTSDYSNSDESFRLLWEVNVIGTWNTNTEFFQFIKSSREKSSGSDAKHPAVSIVNVGSMASVRGFVGLSGYVASKHAVLGLSRTFAQEWGPQGFRVNTVAPGGINTPMIQGITQDWDNLAYKGAFKQLSEPEEIADTIIYLLGDNSSSISGQVIEVNGGWP